MELTHLMTMKKEDWLKLATPISICLLAASIFTVPQMINAQSANGGYYSPIYIKCIEGCN